MFKQRSYKRERLDEADIPVELLNRNLEELEIINKYLGGHRVSTRGLKALLTDKSANYHLMDIGCGGGDSLKAIDSFALKKGYNVRLTGIDLKSDCIRFAESNCQSIPRIQFKCADFRTVFSEQEKVDLVHASLFCHHFKEEEIIEFIRLCKQNKAIFVINDLERNALAYYAIKLLTSVFSQSELVKNDAPLSVKRGFKRKEWQDMIRRAGITRYSIQNRWAFRHLIIIYPNE